MAQFNLVINRQGILDAIDQALDDTIAEIDEAFTESIEQPLYTWANFTVRRSGERVSSPRNIVDLANLKDSQTHYTTLPLTYEFAWGVPYAGLVHEGGYIRQAGGNFKYYPGRPWTTFAIKGDVNAPVRYQNPQAILDVPMFFNQAFNNHMTYI